MEACRKTEKCKHVAHAQLAGPDGARLALKPDISMIGSVTQFGEKCTDREEEPPAKAQRAIKNATLAVRATCL